MADIARMRFKSIKSPREHGTLVLSDDGQFRIEPSPEFRDEMARLEEIALHRSQVYGRRLGLILLALGALALGIGWFLGRVFGKLGSSLSLPRPVGDVHVQRDPGGGVRVILHGLENRFQVVQMAWNADEVLQPEAEAFLKKFDEMKG